MRALPRQSLSQVPPRLIRFATRNALPTDDYRLLDGHHAIQISNESLIRDTGNEGVLRSVTAFDHSEVLLVDLNQRRNFHE